jgi:hypothetical protein
MEHLKLLHIQSSHRFRRNPSKEQTRSEVRCTIRIGLRTFNNNPGALTTTGLSAACEETCHCGTAVTLAGFACVQSRQFHFCPSRTNLRPSIEANHQNEQTVCQTFPKEIWNSLYEGHVPCTRTRGQDLARFRVKSILARRHSGLRNFTSDMSLIIPMTCRANQIRLKRRRSCSKPILIYFDFSLTRLWNFE